MHVAVTLKFMWLPYIGYLVLLCCCCCCVHLDEISNAICSVIDAAELCRNVHPDEYVLHSIAYFML